VQQIGTRQDMLHGLLYWLDAAEVVLARLVQKLESHGVVQVSGQHEPDTPSVVQAMCKVRDRQEVW